MSKHTPGPYKADTVSANTGDIGVSALDGRIVVASVHNGASAISLLRDGTAETQWANARLIAAAPEMLEALRPLANYLAILETMGGPSGGKGMNGDDHLWHVSSSAGDAVITFGDLQRARAAIAKAEGRS